MKILQLISSGGYYGAENMLLNLITAQKMTGSQNLLAVFHNHHQPNLELYQRAIARGVNAKIIECQGKADWRCVRDIRRLVQEHGIGVIHTHGYKADLYGYIAARCERRPVVATCHNWLAGGAALAAYNFLDRLALKHFDAVAPVSDAIAEKLVSCGVRRESITVIPNGVDVDVFKARAVPPPARKEQVLGVIGRLDLQKGFEYLFKAVSGLRSFFPGLRVMVVGEGPDRDKIERLVTQHRLNGVVIMAGRQTDMLRVYNSIDVFVLPSLNEGLPMTLLEAMAACRPVIATRVGAVPHVITDGVTGLLIEPANEMALTSAISQLLSDFDFSQQLARRARAHVEEHYTATAMAEKYRELYAAVMRRRENKEQVAAPASDSSVLELKTPSPGVAPASIGAKENSAG